MIQAGQTIQRLVPSRLARSSSPASADKISVLVKGGHLPMTSSELKRGLQAGPQNSTRVVWSDGVDSLQDDNGQPDGDREDFVEVLEHHRRFRKSQRGLENGESTAHLPEETTYVVDVLVGGGDDNALTIFVSTAIQSTSTHGTGCTLSAAIASELAFGKSSESATRAGHCD
jgi:hydroxymethylpyrimidine/phosphomethylpyrimidine kinase